MRIAFISPFSPLKGGIARFSDQLTAVLRQQGHAVQPFGFRKLFPSFMVRGNASFVVTTPALPSAGEHPFLILYNPFSWFGLIRRLKKVRPEIVLVAYWTGFLAPLLFLLRIFSPIPVVVLLHNASSHEPFLLDPFFRRLLLFSADGFLTLSASVSRELLAGPGSLKPRTELFHPVYTVSGRMERAASRRKLGLDDTAPVLLFFGYVRHYKGLDLLLQAMPVVIAGYPSVRLLVAGQFYEPERRYRALIAKLGIGAHVDLRPGYVGEEDAAVLFGAADAVVLPYRSASQSGVAQLAYGYGLPVIVTPVGSLADQVEHGRTGWVASGASVTGVSDAIRSFFACPRRAAMSRYIGERYGATQSWEELAAGVGLFLESFVQR